MTTLRLSPPNISSRNYSTSNNPHPILYYLHQLPSTTKNNRRKRISEKQPKNSHFQQQTQEEDLVQEEPDYLQTILVLEPLNYNLIPLPQKSQVWYVCFCCLFSLVCLETPKKTLKKTKKKGTLRCRRSWGRSRKCLKVKRCLNTKFYT